jgi:hypothetical protein
MLGYISFEEMAKGSLERDGIKPEYSREQIHELVERNGQIDGLETSWQKRMVKRYTSARASGLIGTWMGGSCITKELQKI